MARTPLHLRPTAPLASRVLLPGDPGRALLLAQELLDGPKMFNHHRGLWGYTGPSVVDGELLTIQATGMGSPSAAIVFEELIDLGVTRAIRVGTCGALASDLPLGSLVVASAALCTDGVSRALGAAESAPASLLDGLHGDVSGLIASSDVFYDPRDTASEWRAAGALAVEMEAAALFTIGARRSVSVGCICVVSDVIAEGSRIDDDALEEASRRMGHAAVAALPA
jgi:uridine phosphorylase